MPLVLAQTATPWENDGSAQGKGIKKNKDAGIARNTVFTTNLSEFGDDNAHAHKTTTKFQDIT